ncbi:MAG: histidinol dehydrogenase [Thermoanaerobaculia bacterium]
MKDFLEQLEKRRAASSAEAFRVADEVIAGVRARGDAFVAEQIARFDGVEIAEDEILQRVVENSAPSVSSVSSVVEVAIERTRSFHLEQMPRGYMWTRNDTTIEHRVRPLRRVGIYVPGGRAVYLSTLIMCAVPARIAGVREIVVATTPKAAARPELQYACSLLGVNEIYRAGGAAGIAALAFGTQTLGRVDKIVGPCNSYVTAAKARVIGAVGIDMTAGPTELVVIADETGDADLIAADLLAQAEHGPDSAVILLTPSESLARRVEQLAKGAYVFLVDIDEAIAIANRIAPEHLSIQARDSAAVAAKAENCGAIYIGPHSAPAAGDYLLGSNHVLPTGGTARFFSPLGVYDFVKRTNVITTGAADAEELAPLVNAFAEFEGLPAHGRSAMVRA